MIGKNSGESIEIENSCNFFRYTDNDNNRVQSIFSSLNSVFPHFLPDHWLDVYVITLARNRNLVRKNDLETDPTNVIF